MADFIEIKGENLTIEDLAHAAYHPELKVVLAAAAKEKMQRRI